MVFAYQQYTYLTEQHAIVVMPIRVLLCIDETEQQIIVVKLLSVLVCTDIGVLLQKRLALSVFIHTAENVPYHWILLPFL